MGLKSSLVNSVFKNTVKLYGLNRAQRLIRFLEYTKKPVFDVTHAGLLYHLYSPNGRTLWRAETYFTKEPETIAWIDTFKEKEVLFDIGANIGLFSIYAAKKNVMVYAFEPESHNYSVLNENISLNQLDARIMAVNIAFCDRNKLDYIYIPKFEAGGSLSNFGDTAHLDARNIEARFKQGVLGLTLDHFVEHYLGFTPDHIKIDVDGIEDKIIQGASKTLSDPRLKSVLIEINSTLDGDQKILDALKNAGFRLDTRLNALNPKTPNQVFRR